LVQSGAPTAPFAPAELAALRGSIQSELDRVRDPVHRLRLIWTAHALGAAPPASLDRSFASTSDEHQRVWQLRLAVDRFAPSGEQFPQRLADSLAKVARTERSGLVQLYLASALERMTLPQRWPVAEALASHGEFADDRMLPLMICMASSQPCRTTHAAMQLVATSKIPLVRKYLSRRLTEEIETDPTAVNTLVELAAASDAAVAQDVMAGMAEALRGWSRAPQPAGWARAAAKLAAGDSPELKQHVQELGVVFWRRPRRR